MSPADRLRDLIENDPRPITEIAAEVEPPMTQGQLSNIKNGVKADPQLSTVARILRALGRRFADLDDVEEDRP